MPRLQRGHVTDAKREAAYDLRKRIHRLIKQARFDVYTHRKAPKALVNFALDACVNVATIRRIVYGSHLITSKQTLYKILGALYARYSDRRHQAQEEVQKLTEKLHEVERLREQLAQVDFVTDYESVPGVPDGEKYVPNQTLWKDI